MPGCWHAVQIACASAASVLLRCTNGRTFLGEMSRTSWPKPVRARPQSCAPPQASMTTSAAVRLANHSSILARFNCKRSMQPVSISTQCS